MSELVTGEAVPLELRVARLATRMLAFAIDVLVLVAVGVPLVVVVGLVAGSLDPALQAALVLVVVVAVLIGLPTAWESLSRGRSLGKAALGLRVVRDDGGPVRFRQSLARAAAGVFVDFVTTVGSAAVICSVLSRTGKRVGDLLAGTLVVRERLPKQRYGVPGMPPALAGWASGAELSRLPDPLALAAGDVLARWPELAPEARERMATQLATQVATLVSPPPPLGAPAPAYLAAVLAERHRRALVRLRGG